MNRKGDWLQTFSGRKFWPLDSIPEDIYIEDIAHALSLICRFGGHCSEFYSVAQHSVLVAGAVTQEHKLWALLHDATEAYLGDIVRPLKHSQQLLPYRQIETALMHCICLRFGMLPMMPQEVKYADNCMLLTEKRELLRHDLPWTPSTAQAYRLIICPVSPEEAEQEFLETFHAIQTAK